MGSGQDSPSRITLSHSLIGWARRLVFISMISIFDADEGILAPFFFNTLFDFLFFSFVVVSHCCFLFFFPVVSVRFRFLVRRVHSSRSLIRFFFAICAVVLGRLMLNPEGSCRCHCANLPNYVNGTRNDRRRKATFWFVSSLFCAACWATTCRSDFLINAPNGGN